MSDFEAKSVPKSISSGALPQILLWELPRPPSWKKGPTAKGRGVEGGEGRGEDLSVYF